MKVNMPLEEKSRQLIRRSADRPEPVEIWKARNFIREHFDEEISLSQMAKSVNVSANYLSEKFKKVTGVNFVDYVAETRMERARYFLRDPALRISEIAFAVGFQSLSQFNRVFKKRMRQSPTEFREHLTGKRPRKVQARQPG